MEMKSFTLDELQQVLQKCARYLSQVSEIMQEQQLHDIAQEAAMAYVYLSTKKHRTMMPEVTTLQ